MSLLSFFIAVITVSSVFPVVNKNSEASVKNNVLASNSAKAKYNTLEIPTITKAKENKYYFVPTVTSVKPAYIKLNNPSTVLQSPTSIPVSTSTVNKTETVIIITSAPTNIPTDIPANIPAPTANVQNTGSKENYIMNKINEYRISRGLTITQPDSNTCNFAKKRAQEISTNFNHDGFKPPPYPSYSSVTENIAMNTDYTQVANQWIASAGHAANMEKDTPYVCVGSFTNYYVMEGWKP